MGNEENGGGGGLRAACLPACTNQPFLPIQSYKVILQSISIAFHSSILLFSSLTPTLLFTHYGQKNGTL